MTVFHFYSVIKTSCCNQG